MLRVLPSEILTFRQSDNFESYLNLSNLSSAPVTYKIQTTSPEKFRVKPRCGLLQTGESVSINIALKPGEKIADGIGRDKFLVMASPILFNIDPARPMTEFWKQMPPNSDIKEYRLSCAYESTAVPIPYRKGTKSDYSVNQSDYIYLNDTNKNVYSLERQLNYTQILQIVIIILLILLSACFGFLMKKQLDFDPQGQIAAIMKAELQEFSCPLKKKI
ncbi:motile sperm domain-containing protein 2-like [Teleopsis dalmanni]|uniref:motile sperm domain-containing protein 2-like n=1 Tax=Teleopsis dalmanni TaxID=139649 RepID=UPI000D329669|nr:motile sperm domain-containing protein 2-like [Teleopsis dalmanni]